MKHSGEVLKALAKMMMKLNPEEESLLDGTNVKTMNQREMKKNYPDRKYDVFASTRFDDKNSPEIVSSDEYPIIPRLTLGNLDAFGTDGYFTEPEIISHELGHVSDFKKQHDIKELGSIYGRRISSEPSAIGFSENILVRNRTAPKEPRFPFNKIFGIGRNVDPVFGSRYFVDPSVGIDYVRLSPAQKALRNYQI